jgi:serine/threonine protein kinase
MENSSKIVQFAIIHFCLVVDDVETCQKVHHPNIVGYYGIFESTNVGFCLVTEYMVSGTLLQLCRNTTIPPTHMVQ